MALSHLEDKLSYHIRTILNKQFHIGTLTKTAFVISLASCLTAGFITLISLYTVPWQRRLNYTLLQVNLISSAVNLSGYLSPPLLGILSDSHGPVLLSWVSFFGFVPSYAYLSWTFQKGSEPHFIFSIISFLLIGISTSSLFFSTLLTCTKFYPNKKLLSISLPTTCYGLSSIIGLQLLKIRWFWNKDNYLELNKVFKIFALLYTLVYILTWISTSVVSLLKLEIGTLEVRKENTPDENQQLVPISEMMRYESKVYLFFKDISSYVLLFIMFLTLGPLEMFITNMGSLSSLLNPESSNIQTTVLSYYVMSSTVSRLGVGLLLDFCMTYRFNKSWIVYLLILIGLAGQLLGIISISKNISISFVSLFSGVTYGGLFTIFPTIAMNTWGEDIFGTSYGSLMIAPALGATIYGILYATIYDVKCTSAIPDPSCIKEVFDITILSYLIALMVTFIFLMICRKRKRFV